MKKLILIFSVVFLLTTFYTIAPANVVPGAVLYLDASDNPADPEGWTNLGTAGGELPPMDQAPELETGTIEIPDLDIVQQNVKYYTAEKSAQMFGTKALGELELLLEDWTIEFLVRRNGDLFSEEHQLAGLNTLPEGRQGMRLGLDGGGNLGIGIYHGGADAGVASNIVLEEGEWNWVSISAEDKDKILVYQNGGQVSEQPGLDFDPDVPLGIITIGAFSPGERSRNFNGSIAFFRVYDKALDEDEIMQNIDAWAGGLAVDPDSKLTTTWGREKTRY